MRKPITALILALTFAAATGAAASEIYMWTDKDGNAQYGDRPTEGSVRITSIESQSTNRSQVQATVQARLDRRAAAAEAARNEPQGPSKEELRAKAEERAGQCQSFRSRLETLITSRRLYHQGENGEREYLGDAAMDAARTKAQSQVEEYCSS